MLIWVIRALYLLIIAGTAAQITSDYSGMLNIVHSGLAPYLMFTAIVGVSSLVVVIDLLYPHKRLSTITAVYFGLLIGSLLGHLLRLALEPTLQLWAFPGAVASVSLVMTIILCYICVSFLLQTKNNFRFIIPYVEFSPQVRGGRPLVLDTSVIIDGRIIDIAETGLIDQTIVVPRFVLQELQNIADSSDRLRRNRGRRGLDVLDRLQKCDLVDVNMHESDDDTRIKHEVDSRLIQLTKSLGGKLVTNDTNLAKMAKIQDVQTININEVSNAAKPPVLWGETLTVKLVKEGEERGQGIGYLDDGTMVVAEMGKNFVGTEVNLVVTSVLQTNAGRMVFGRIDSRNPEPVKYASTKS